MARIKWNQIGQKLYEAGVDHGILYPQDSDTGEFKPGSAWNGLISVAETPEGAEPNDQYADNIKYLSLMSAEDLNGTIEAYTYPKAWEACDGSAEPVSGVTITQQQRKPFGLCYRTKIGNDTDDLNHGFKLHLLYGAKASPSERTYETLNDSPDPTTFSWDYTTTPVNVTGYEPTSLLIINSTLCNAEKLNALLDVLYGTDAAGIADGDTTTTGTEARLPLPDEVFAILGDGVNSAAAKIARQNNMIGEL